MQLKKMMMALVAGSLAIAAQALTLSVKDVKIAQRYPWNGLVDIDYTVVCDEPTTNIWIYPVGYDADFNVSVAPRTLEGDGANGVPVTVGTEGEKKFRMTWNMATDMPENYNRAKFSMKVHAYAGAAPYMVVDLSPGASAEKYEVTYLTEIPGGEWSDEYKTTKLVLKLIPPGTMQMGEQTSARYWTGFRTYHTNNRTYTNEISSSANNFGNSNVRNVTLLKPFYFSVFPLSCFQYGRIMGVNSYTQKVAITSLSYTAIRGGTLGAKYPGSMQVDADSLLGVIRSRTGITVDIPTDAQWEFAARAYESASCAPTWNGFGLYGMSQSPGCWCRDWFGVEAVSGVDPKGPTSGQSRSIRGYVPYADKLSYMGTGGYWYDNSTVFFERAISARNGKITIYYSSRVDYIKFDSQYTSPEVGCRLVAIPAE